MSEESSGEIISFHATDSKKIQEILSKVEDLNSNERLLITRHIVSTMSHQQIEEILNYVKPLLDCNLILALHQSGYVTMVHGILDSLDVISILNLERTCSSIFSIIRMHFCWKTMIENKIASDPVWLGIVERRGWVKYFDISDYRLVKNLDFYRSLYRHIIREIQNLRSRWRSGRYIPERILFNGTDGVYCLQYDSEKIISGHRDNTIKIWNINKKRIEKILHGHNGSVLCLQFDDLKIISGSSDCTIRVWDILRWEEVQKLNGHAQPVLYLRYDDKILVTCSKDNTAIVWTQKMGKGFVQVSVLAEHRAAVNVVDFNDSYIVTASGDRSIIVWSRETFQITAKLFGHKRGIACLHQRGDVVASGSSDKTIRLWDVVNGVCLRVLTGHDDLVRCIRFNQDYIISGSYDAKIKIWDYRSIMSPDWNERENCLATLQEHSGRVFRLMFDEFQIMTCSHDDTIMIWNFFNDKFDPCVGTPFA